MLFYYFKLDEYFQSTKKHFYFIDGLFRACERTKKDVFDELKIPDSTYRTNRLKTKAKNSWTYVPIIEYFGYKNIDYNRQKEYENCLAKIYHNVYFKNVDTLKELSKTLDEYIAEQNVLKPVFILFKVLCGITVEERYSKQKSVIEEYLPYLEQFRKNYYTDDLEFLYLIISFYVGKSMTNTPIEKHIHQNSKLVWYYYFLSGAYYYIKKKDYESLTGFEKSATYMLDDFNIDRYAMVTNNISFLYNVSGRYALGLENSSKLVKYAFSSETSNKYCVYAVNHYLFASYMLNKFEEIVEFFEFITKNRYDDIDCVYIFMAIIAYAKTKNDKYSEFISKKIKEDDMLSKFSELVITKCISKQFVEQLDYDAEYWPKIRQKIKLDISKL